MTAGMAAVVDKMVTRLKDYQATAVPPVRPEGCNPVIDERDAWRPCDSPEVCSEDWDGGTVATRPEMNCYLQ